MSGERQKTPETSDLQAGRLGVGGSNPLAPTILKNNINDLLGPDIGAG